MADIPKFTVQIKPFNDTVAVVPDKMETMTASGIVIPDTVKGEKSMVGMIVAVGNGELDDDKNPSKWFKVGDKVAFGRYAGEDIEFTTTSGEKIEVKFLSIESIRSIVS